MYEIEQRLVGQPDPGAGRKPFKTCRRRKDCGGPKQARRAHRADPGLGGRRAAQAFDVLISRAEKLTSARAAASAGHRSALAGDGASNGTGIHSRRGGRFHFDPARTDDKCHPVVHKSAPFMVHMPSWRAAHSLIYWCRNSLVPSEGFAPRHL
jgi:hypothetical protein